MTLDLDQSENPVSAPRWGLSLTTLALGGLLGCGLIGVEPDEIDILEGTSDGTPDGDGDGDSDTDNGTSMTTGVTTDPGGSTGTEGTDGGSDGAETASCEDLDPISLELGANEVAFAAGDSVFEASCGGPGLEQLYSFTAELGGQLAFELSGGLEGGAVLYIVDGCDPLSELACGGPVLDGVTVEAGDTVYVFVDLLAADADASGELLVQAL